VGKICYVIQSGAMEVNLIKKKVVIDDFIGQESTVSDDDDYDAAL
jgi:hypothetical protein